MPAEEYDAAFGDKAHIVPPGALASFIRRAFLFYGPNKSPYYVTACGTLCLPVCLYARLLDTINIIIVF
jgi:hypothetical protein